MDKHRTAPLLAAASQLINGSSVHTEPMRQSPPKKDNKSFVQFMKDRFNKSVEDILPVNSDNTTTSAYEYINNGQRSTSKSPIDTMTTTSSTNRVAFLSPNSTYTTSQKEKLIINYKPPMSPPREASPTRHMQQHQQQQHTSPHATFKSLLHNKLNNITNETRLLNGNRHRQSKSVDLSSDDKLEHVHTKEELNENMSNVTKKPNGGSGKKDKTKDICKTATYSVSEPNLSANMTIKSDTAPSTPSKYSNMTCSNTKLDFVRRSYSFDEEDDDNDDENDDDDYDDLNGLMNGVELDNNSSSGCGSENRFEDIYEGTSKLNGHVVRTNGGAKHILKSSNL
jgi:hypothetical protein